MDEGEEEDKEVNGRREGGKGRRGGGAGVSHPLHG